MIFPTLYKKSAHGKMCEWTIKVVQENEYPEIVMTSGYVDGKKNDTRRAVKRGTNTGKRNAKTPYEQACFNAQNAFNDRIDAGFREDIEEARKGVELPPTPMLAATFNESLMLAPDFFPCAVQPKYNGVRCTMYRHLGDKKFLSRARKEFPTLDFMYEEVERFFGEYSPDGEIYIHGMPLQNIISLLKRKQPESVKLKYVIYDLAIPDKTYEERVDLLQLLYADYFQTYGKPKYIELAPVTIVKTEEALKEVNETVIDEGYEGLIIRRLGAFYGFNKRTPDLLKYKNFQDSEFEIVGAIPERYFDKLKGIYREVVIWVCRSVENAERTFHVRPLGSVEEKEEAYKNRAKYIGKNLTVRYLELSTDGVPVGNPVGIAVRDYE